MRQSGNHGRNSDSSRSENSNAPRQSSQIFTPPSGGTVKKSPPVKDIIKDPVVIPEPEKANLPEPEKAETQNPPPSIENAEPIEEKNNATSEPQNEIPPLDFSAHWLKIADLCFDKMPTVYYSIKEQIPDIENNIVTIRITNPIQKDLIESKKREMLSYLRTHFDNTISEIEVVVDEHIETKARIFTAQDKVSELAQQNEELVDFLKILNLSVKD
ncbi:hypothetical protein LJC68_06485 [Bacteroidales bacterium OttesenSCG-928-B11]|nr:hypothetical protein [Bacteroidales bacterium OttesenSCG-928-B11]